MCRKRDVTERVALWYKSDLATLSVTSQMEPGSTHGFVFQGTASECTETSMEGIEMPG